MNKKIFFIIIYIFLVFSQPFFSMAKKMESNQQINKIVEIAGFIKIFGSEPNTQVGFVTNDGLEYSLKASEKTLAIFRNKQGIQLRLEGYISFTEDDFVFDNLKDGFFEVVSWKEVLGE